MCIHIRIIQKLIISELKIRKENLILRMKNLKQITVPSIEDHKSCIVIGTRPALLVMLDSVSHKDDQKSVPTGDRQNQNLSHRGID